MSAVVSDESHMFCSGFERRHLRTLPSLHSAPSRSILLSKCCIQIGTIISEENKKHPKTQHTRKRRQSTISRICVFRCVAFSGALCSPLRGRQNTPENATHPKTQILGTVDYLRFRVCCVFGCSLAPANHQDPANRPCGRPCLCLLPRRGGLDENGENDTFFRKRSTTTRDRNLQFRGAVSTGGSPLDFLLFLQVLCVI